jgi:hypothetical protein
MYIWSEPLDPCNAPRHKPASLQHAQALLQLFLTHEGVTGCTMEHI